MSQREHQFRVPQTITPTLLFSAIPVLLLTPTLRATTDRLLVQHVGWLRTSPQACQGVFQTGQIYACLLAESSLTKPQPAMQKQNGRVKQVHAPTQAGVSSNVMEPGHVLSSN